MYNEINSNSFNETELSLNNVKDIISSPKDNIQFIKGNYGAVGELIYTCEYNDMLLKIVEFITEDAKEVSSTFYIYVDDDYRYLTDVYTSIDNLEISTTINYRGITEITSQPLSTNQSTVVEEKISLNPQTGMTPNATWDGMPVSNWIYYGTFNDYTTIIIYTVGAITSVLASLVGNALFSGLVATGTYAWLTYTVQFIIDNHIAKVYYTDVVYYQKVIPPEDWMLAQKVAEKDYFTFYKDSKRTDRIDSGSVYHYRDGYTN